MTLLLCIMAYILVVNKIKNIKQEGKIMKKKYHVISAKNFGYESVLGDGTYDYFVFSTDEFVIERAMPALCSVTIKQAKVNSMPSNEKVSKLVVSPECEDQIDGFSRFL